MKSLVPRQPGGMSGRGIQVVRGYVHAGNAASRFLWVRVRSGNPALGLVLAPVAVTAVLVVLLLVVMAVGLSLLAVSLLWSLSKTRLRES